MELKWKQIIPALLIGGLAAAFLSGGSGSGQNFVSDFKDSDVAKSFSSSIGNEYSAVNLRELSESPEQFNNETVKVKGVSNSLQDFIKSEGRTLDLDCSKYSDFNYGAPQGIIVYGKIDSSGGQPTLVCTEPPEVQS